MSRAQHILALIVGLITGVLLMESYGAMVHAARAGGRAIPPELWPLGTEALALAMEVSVLEAKRLGHRAVLRLSWLLLVASVALSTLLQVAVAPPSLVGYLTAGATPVWLLGSFAVLSLLYRADLSADPSATAAEASAERPPASADPAPSSTESQRSGAEVLTRLVRQAAPWLLAVRGVGPVSAAQLLISWSHPGRLRSEAAFAMLAGVAPLEASSGRVVRHRLNRAGDRQLNRALHTIVLVRLRDDPTTRAYAARRAAEGKSAREVRRCLKRAVARQLFRLLERGGEPRHPRTVASSTQR